MTLIDRITAEMTTDTDNMAKQSELLTRLYTEADAAGKALLDDAFICLCGWKLATLLERQAQDPDGDDDEDYDDFRDKPYDT